MHSFDECSTLYVLCLLWQRSAATLCCKGFLCIFLQQCSALIHAAELFALFLPSKLNQLSESFAV